MALETAEHLQQLGDALTASANAIHARLMHAINNQEISAEEARNRLQDEGALRQHANALYSRAGQCVVSDLQLAQETLLTTVRKANEKLEKLKKVASVIDFMADLLALATAAYAGKAPVILAAFKEVKRDVDAFESESP